MPRLFRLSLLFTAVVWGQAHAQTLPSPSAQTEPIPAKSEADLLVDQLIENAARNLASLPSLTAHESIVSRIDEVVFFGKSVSKAEATVRLVRRSTDGPYLKESREITMLNGKPVAPGQHVGLVFNFENDFDDFQSQLFNAQHRGCSSFTLAPHPDPGALLALSINPRPDAAALPECAHYFVGRAGIVRIEPATHQVAHLEFTSPVASGGSNHGSVSIAIDYAPAKVGDKIFWLPTIVTAHWVVGKTPYTWLSRYSDYHQYTSTVTIQPGTTAP